MRPLTASRLKHAATVSHGQTAKLMARPHETAKLERNHHVDNGLARRITHSTSRGSKVHPRPPSSYRETRHNQRKNQVKGKRKTNSIIRSDCFEQNHSREAAHIEFLLEQDYSHNLIAQMISQMNGIRVSRKLIDRYVKRHPTIGVRENKKLIRPETLQPLRWTCSNCYSHKLIVDRERQELVCTECGTVLLESKASRVISLGQQIECSLAESPLSESNGLGSFLTYRDLTRLGVKRIASWVYRSVQDPNEPKPIRAMRRYSKKILDALPGLTSKTDEIIKARKPQISKATKELLEIVYYQASKEMQQSNVLTSRTTNVKWRAYVPGILQIVLSDYLPSDHRALTAFQTKYPTSIELSDKIRRLLNQQLTPQPTTPKPTPQSEPLPLVQAT